MHLNSLQKSVFDDAKSPLDIYSEGFTITKFFSETENQVLVEALNQSENEPPEYKIIRDNYNTFNKKVDDFKKDFKEIQVFITKFLHEMNFFSFHSKDSLAIGRIMSYGKNSDLIQQAPKILEEINKFSEIEPTLPSPLNRIIKMNKKRLEDRLNLIKPYLK